MSKGSLRLLVSLLLCLSLIPALMLVWNRVRFERDHNTLALVLDYQDVLKQARENGLDDATLLKRYKAFGVNGVAVYESTLGRLLQNDQVVYRDGSGWRNERLSLRQDVSQIQSREYYLRSLEPGVAERFAAKYRYQTRRVRIDGLDWLAFPIDVLGLPAGPDSRLISRLEGLGFFVVYRPFDQVSVNDPGADFPKVPYLVYGGDSVSGADDPQKLARVIERTRSLITGFVEATEQKGIEEVAQKNPVVRVFSIRPEWQALLQPEEVASKFVLAARERNHRLLYLRPYLRVDDTERFLSKVNEGLSKASLKLGLPVALEFQPQPELRRLALLGPLLALVLLALSFSNLIWGGVLAVLVFALCIVVGGANFAGAALIAACVFPALGFVISRGTPLAWFKATLVTLMGALFVAGLGAGRDQLLTLEPFRGVALTLFLPPLILAAAMLPNQDIRQTIRELWSSEISLGTLVLAALAAGAVFLVLDRRGNTSSVGISATEAKVRAALQDSLIRPRTKELLLHPLALLGTARGWPLWFSNLLLLAGVVGQGSIIDSFAHYHTPVLISLLRTVNGIGAGLLLGLLVLPLSVVLREWMARAPGMFSKRGR